MRILQVVNDMHRAGLETMLMNYYKYKEASENPATCDSPKLFVKITISGSTSMI